MIDSNVLNEILDNSQSKEVVIHSSSRDKNKDFSDASIPSFVRNVMGSSAGAGSGEFHVYRHLRRKEYARQKGIEQKSKQVCRFDARWSVGCG